MKFTLGQIVRLWRTVWRTYGARGLRRRAVHELRRAAGGFHREPHQAIDRGTSAPAGSVYAGRGSFDRLSSDIQTRILERGERVVSGSYEAFGHRWRSFPSTTRGWSTTDSGSFSFPDGPWWTVPHLPPQADIKEVWEPARFGWAYDLIRAYKLSGDPALAATFYQRFEEWTESSPPFYGVHWSCGQETAIRAIALLHAEAALPQIDGDRMGVVRALAWSGERIEDAIVYGLSQRNNHGISESAGLVHIGLRLRSSHPRAAEWVTRGRRLLDEQIQDQFLGDGWYAQHSFYYMRVALDQALLAQRALEQAGQSLAKPSIIRLEAAFQLLAMLVDAESGEVPNFGANDGSRVSPISSSAYRDFRPLLTLASLVLGSSLPADIPADSEVLAWVGGKLPPRTSPRADGVYRGTEGGWLTIRHRGVVAFLRAGEFHHRPSHLDLLHLNVSVDGREIIVDPGSYAYNAPTPWKNGLAVGRVHNGPVLDDQEPASNVHRFLWSDWPSSRIVGVETSADGVLAVAEIPGRVRRDLLIRRDEVTVTDTVLDARVQSVQVTWLLSSEVADLDIVHANGASDLRPAGDAVDAWFSPSYLLRVPTRAIRARRGKSEGETLEVCTSIILSSAKMKP